MGQALRNPRSLAGGKSVQSVQRARLARVVSALTTPDRVDTFLDGFPAHTRDQVAQMIQPMLPPQGARVPMIDTHTVDPTRDTEWPGVKQCSHRVIRKMEACGCWIVGYGYSVEHAGQRAGIGVNAHKHDGPRVGGCDVIIAMSFCGPHIYCNSDAVPMPDGGWRCVEHVSS